MTDPNPIAPPDFTSSLKTVHGNVYFYEGGPAALAVMFSMIRVQAALQQQKANAAARIVRMLAGKPDILPIETIAEVVGAVASTVGAFATIAGEYATVAGAGASIAGVAMQKGSKAGNSLELVIHNETLTPVVPVRYKNGHSSIVSSCRPLLPGTAGTIDIAQPPPGFTTNSWIEVEYLSGAGVYNDSGTMVEMAPVKSVVQFEYTYSSWFPDYAVDPSAHEGKKSFSCTTKNISAIYFQPTPGIHMLPLTIASFLSQQSTSSIDIMFLPGSAIVTPASS